MKISDRTHLDRRTFIHTLSLATAGALTQPMQAAAAGTKIKLGMDNFAVRAMGWKAPELLDYAASLKLDTIVPV